MVLQTEQGKKRFLVLDPNHIVVTPREMEMNCGAQEKALQVALEFEAPPAGSNADGVVRAVHFPE